jgi:hypothetical protein
MAVPPFLVLRYRHVCVGGGLAPFPRRLPLCPDFLCKIAQRYRGGFLCRIGGCTKSKHTI